MINQKIFLAKMTNLIYKQREDKDFCLILQAIATEARDILKVDRLKIYKFDLEGNGEVIAEAHQENRLPSLLGLHFPHTDIPSPVRQSLIKSPGGVAIDVTAKRKIIYQDYSCDYDNSEEANQVIYQSADPCHIEYLLAMGVLSSLAIPILYWGKLWGLLVIHHSQPRRFQQSEIHLVQILSKQISLGLNQETLMAQSQYQKNQQLITERINNIWWNNQTNQQQKWQKILAMGTEYLHADGGLVYLVPDLTGAPAQIYDYGEVTCWKKPTISSDCLNVIKEIALKDIKKKNISTDSPQIYTREELIAALGNKELVNFFHPHIHSFLFISLHHHHQWIGCIALFRKEQQWEILWAGRQDTDKRHLQPRKSFQAWCETKRGSPYWNKIEINLAKEIGKYLYILLTQQRLNDIIERQVNYDSLTQLPNNYIFSQKLNLSLVDAIYQGEIVGIVMLDLDQFKRINESAGHTVGDYLLQQIAERLKNYLETLPKLEPFLARWHGDRFVILWHKLTYAEELVEICKSILAIVQKPFQCQNQYIYISTSIGVSLAPYDGDNTDTLIKNSETAMYKAKAQGKNTYEFYNSELKQQNLNWLTFASDLRQAIQRQEIMAHYQPQVCLKTGEIIGVEALMRWHHPKLGWISPAQFIPLAEEIGMIHELGQWILTKACQQQHFWESTGFPSVRMSVNISPLQLQKPTFLEEVESILEYTQINPHYLELEITESTILKNIEQTIKILTKLTQKGISIAIDDFGTGYSSLSILKDLPVNVLKIDKLFIDNLEKSENSAKLCQSIIMLAKSLNLRVIAEGVENKDQTRLLKQFDCDEIQGYFISPPLNSEHLTNMLIKTIANQLELPVTQRATTLNTRTYLEKADEQINKSNIISIETKLIQQIQAYEGLQKEIKETSMREHLLIEIAQKIRESLNLEDILRTTVNEVRHVLNTDRVILFKFDENYLGEVVVESVSESQLSILGEYIKDECFTERYVEYYRQGRIKAIEDVYTANIQECHLNLLKSYQVKSNLVLPIIHQQTLWGLLIAHECYKTRKWKEQEVTLLSQLATQIAIAIYQGELYNQLQIANKQLQKLSYIDGLTQVANRHHFDTYLQECWQKLLPLQETLSLILCDVDFFKNYNDTYGHLAGDKCLKAIANTLANSVTNPNHLVARYGGEEFAIILPKVSRQFSVNLALSIRKQVKALNIPHSSSNYSQVTLSVGVASLVPHIFLSTEVLIQRADQALYTAKAQGRDSVQSF